MEEKVIIYVDAQGVIYMSQNDEISLVQVEVDVLPEVVERPLYDAELRYIADEFITNYKLNENKVWGAIHEVRSKIATNPTYENQQELITLEWLLCNDINSAMELKIKELLLFDSSDHVNTFLVDGNAEWLSREERLVLLNRFEREMKKNKELSNLTLKGGVLNMTPAKLHEHITDIADYADICYDNTVTHAARINRIESIEAIKNYDFKTGYPEYVTIYLN